MVGGDHLHAPQLGDDSGKNRTDTRGEQFEASIRLRAGRTALTLGGARSGTVGGIKGELTGIALRKSSDPMMATTRITPAMITMSCASILIYLKLL